MEDAGLTSFGTDATQVVKSPKDEAAADGSFPEHCPQCKGKDPKCDACNGAGSYAAYLKHLQERQDPSTHPFEAVQVFDDNRKLTTEDRCFHCAQNEAAHNTKVGV